MLSIVPSGQRRRGRLKGIAIRKSSVRQARLEAGLSLAQVAAGIVSRAAIHHIENGRVKPSLETLRLIAHQTGKPMEYFLDSAYAGSEVPKRSARQS
jgi:transcriptional regulator with XRE-family HTH domain